MNSHLTFEEVKILVYQLPLSEQIRLIEDLEEQLESSKLMKLAESGFQEWHDPEEDIYPLKSFAYLNPTKSIG
jgi:alpha-D-ribose 1-methylphosphonate 5-phosphate C-P lyase